MCRFFLDIRELRPFCQYSTRTSRFSLTSIRVASAWRNGGWTTDDIVDGMSGPIVDEWSEENTPQEENLGLEALPLPRHTDVDIDQGDIPTVPPENSVGYIDNFRSGDGLGER